MAKRGTGSHLKIEPMGDNVQGVRLFGNPKTPEPVHFRVVFPGGDVDVVRHTNGDNWIHIRVDHPEGDHRHVDDGLKDGFLSGARLDATDKSTNEMDLGDMNDPGLYHLAIRITTEKPNEEESRALARKVEAQA